MPAWLKTIALPLLFVLIAAGLFALHYFKIVNFNSWSLPNSPEFQKFSADLPTILLAFLFGMLGAFIRAAGGAGAVAAKLATLLIGGAIGIVVFIVLKSQVIPQIMYSDFPSQGLKVDFYRMALLAVIGGVYSNELTRWTARKG